VGEESQLDDMRAAIRGDFERLERRRGGQELMRVTEPPASRADADERRTLATEPSVRRSWLDRVLAR